MGCSAGKQQMSESARQFTTMITAKPDFAKYQYKSDNIKTLTKAIASPVFGGSVFLPMGKKGNARTKKNNLEESICRLNTEVIYNGGYYYLPDIREEESSPIYMDVYLLTPSIKDQDLARKIKLIHDLHNQNKELLKTAKNMALKAPKIKGEKQVVERIKTNVEQKPVFWKDIMEGVTGYCRIIKYTNHSVPTVIDVDKMASSGSKMINTKPENLEIAEVIEGQFKDGLKDGYCRVMSARDGSCQVGFFQKNVPMGKYCMYNLDGTYLLPEGLYEGEGQCKSKLDIANYLMMTAVRKQKTVEGSEKKGGVRGFYVDDGDKFDNF